MISDMYLPDSLPDPDLHAEFYADVAVKRLLAWLIDAVLILVLTVLVLPFTAFVGLLFFPLLWLAVGLAYRIATLARGSATPGMRIMAIEIRDRFGRRLDAGTAALHTLVYTVALGSLVVQGISVALMLSTPRGQGIPDLLLGTAAINRPAPR